MLGLWWRTLPYCHEVACTLCEDLEIPLFKKERRKWPPISGALSVLHEGHYWIFLLSSKKGNYFSASSSLVLSPYFLLPLFNPPALSCHHSCGLCSLDDASNLELLGCSYGLLGRPPLLRSLSNVSSGQAEQQSKCPLNSPLLLLCPGGVEISPFPERSSLRNYLKICLNKPIFFPPAPPIYTSPYLKGTPPCVGVVTSEMLLLNGEMPAVETWLTICLPFFLTHHLLLWDPKGSCKKANWMVLETIWYRFLDEETDAHRS